MSTGRSPAAFTLALLATLVLVVSGPTCRAGDPETDEDPKTSEAADSEAKKDAEGKAEKKEPEPGKVYTNADLERLFGPAPPPKTADGRPEDAEAAAGGDPKRPDALDAMQDEQARGRTRQLQAAEVEKVVADKRAEIERLEQRILRIRNPLLPRPEADLTPEEKEEWKGLTAPQRVDLTQEQLDQARKELAEAEARLKKLKSE
jgi:hypothetical protein